jgi:hypothetical protein
MTRPLCAPRPLTGLANLRAAVNPENRVVRFSVLVSCDHTNFFGSALS